MKALGEAEHFLNVLRGLGLDVGADHVEAVHVFMVGLDVGFRDFGAGNAFVVGALDDFVVHVGKVADEGDFIAFIAEQAHEDVERHRGTGMPDVRQRVGRDAAGVDAHQPLADGREGFLFSGHGIVELHGGSFRRGEGGTGALSAKSTFPGPTRKNFG